MELPIRLIEQTLPTYVLIARVKKNDKGQLSYLKKDRLSDKWTKSVDKREFEDVNLKFKKSELVLKEQTINYQPSPLYKPMHLKHLRMGCKLFFNVGFLIQRNPDGIPYVNKYFLNPEQFKIKNNAKNIKNFTPSKYKK